MLDPILPGWLEQRIAGRKLTPGNKRLVSALCREPASFLTPFLLAIYSGFGPSFRRNTAEFWGFMDAGFQNDIRKRARKTRVHRIGTTTRPFQGLSRKIKIHNSKTDAKISMFECKRV